MMLGLILAVTLVIPQAQSRPADPIADRLDKARQECDSLSSRARDDLLRALDAMLEAATDAATKERIKSDRQAFDKRGVLPASAPADARKFEQASTRNALRLQAAYEGAIASYKDSSQHDRATRVADELSRLRAAAEQLRWRDLRSQVDLAKHDATRTWSWQGQSLVSNGQGRGVLRIPVPSDGTEGGYELRFEAERLGGQSDLQLLLSRGDGKSATRVLLVLGGWNGETSGLERLDGKSADDNATTYRGAVFPKGKAAVIAVQCTAEAIVVTANGKRIINCTSLADLALPEGLAREFTDARALQLITSASATFRLDSFALRGIEAAAPPKPVAAPVPAAAVKPDFLAVGTTWRGKTGAGAVATVEVLKRNRGAKTATVKLTIEGGGDFRFALKTNDDGTWLTLANAVRVGAKRVLTNEAGSGSATDTAFHISWSWTADGNGHKQIEGVFNGKR